MPAVRDNPTHVNCPICNKPICRKKDLDRHVRTHNKDNDAPMHACPYTGCTFKTIQKANLQMHIGKHTGDLSHRCPECPFATNYQASLITHRKRFHDYKPTARRYLSGRAAQMSAADLVPCDAAESSHSGNAEFLDEFGEVTWEKLFPPEIYGEAFAAPHPHPHA
ncbi:hypothetical protein CY34DRAFT_15603 [Suillus luteus UH-Slu-Lm8-n1]|uniref:C2H2-type domain-containing protein n=1 Tax=Suillus luteus UH-Slu-Lm8-n1 TaxID=930992 RepID=A0A0C9ZJH6_9AGAM|nr:hypothetical protein CY34DRAFT_15603 [Suillus luteus UH-Slu-Lm8-n1]